MTRPPPGVLITRERAEPLAALLRARGCLPHHVPLQHLQSTDQPPPPGALPAWALVTSAETLLLGGDVVLTVLRASQVVAVGRKTAAALHRAGISVAAVGQAGGREAVAGLAARHAQAGGQGAVWYLGAEAPSAEVEAGLAAWGYPVTRWSVYRNTLPPGAPPLLADVLRAGRVSAVTLASASAAQRYAALLKCYRAENAREDGGGGVAVVVLGASTERAAAAEGLVVGAVAAEPSLEALAAAAASAVGRG